VLRKPLLLVKKKAQLLDNMDLEENAELQLRVNAIQMEYTYKGEEYILNLIDTQDT
jgi:GTP-binding protein LepA